MSEKIGSESPFPRWKQHITSARQADRSKIDQFSNIPQASQSSPYIQRILPPIKAKDLSKLSVAYKEKKTFGLIVKTALLSLKIFRYSIRDEVRELRSSVKIPIDKIKNENVDLKKTINDIIENKGDPEKLRNSLKNQLLNMKDLAKNLSQAIQRGEAQAAKEKKGDIPMVALSIVPELKEWEKILDEALSSQDFQTFIKSGTGSLNLLNQIEVISDLAILMISQSFKE